MSYTLVAGKVVDMTVGDIYTVSASTRVGQVKALDGAYHPWRASSNPVQISIAD